MVEFYFISLFITGLISIISTLFTLRRNKEKSLFSLLIWFIIRFSVECIVYVKKGDLEINFHPLFHSSILLESIVMLSFYIINSKKMKWKQLFYLVPIVLFLFENQVVSSIYSPCRIGNLGYNSIMVILLFEILVFHRKLISDKIRNISMILFLYHCIAFIYTLFIPNLRTNIDLMKMVYPVFFVSIVALNLTISYLLLCLKPKK